MNKTKSYARHDTRSSNPRKGLSTNNMLEYGKEKKIETGTVKPITKVNFKLDKGLLIRGLESAESVADLNE